MIIIIIDFKNRAICLKVHCLLKIWNVKKFQINEKIPIVYHRNWIKGKFLSKIKE